VWFGIVGGALTIAGHWSNIITLADWMRWVVEHWSSMLHMIWHSIGRLFNLNVGKDAALTLSLFAFIISMWVDSIFDTTVVDWKDKSGWNDIDEKEEYPDIEAQPNPIRGVSYLVISLISAIVIMFVYRFNDDLEVLMSQKAGIAFTTALGLLFTIYLISIKLKWKIMSTLEKVYVALIFATMVILLNPLIQAYSRLQRDYILLSLVWYWLFPALIIPAPLKPLVLRLTFLLIGVAIIFGLSEVSKLAQIK
jgi:hypothetical protein